MSTETVTGTIHGSSEMTEEALLKFEWSVFVRRKSLGLSDEEANRGLTKKFTTEE